MHQIKLILTPPPSNTYFYKKKLGFYFPSKALAVIPWYYVLQFVCCSIQFRYYLFISHLKRDIRHIVLKVYVGIAH